MKMFLPLAAIVVLAIGALVGAQTNRYEFVKMGGGYPARFDRWNGRLELITISATAEFKKALPNPTPAAWGAADEAVSPTPNEAILPQSSR